MKPLKEMIGEQIVGLIPMLHPVELQQLTLRGVEAAGVWIESQSFTNQLLEKFGTHSAPKTLVLFVPFDKIHFLLGSEDLPSLSEKAFGLGHT